MDWESRKFSRAQFAARFQGAILVGMLFGTCVEFIFIFAIAGPMSAFFVSSIISSVSLIAATPFAALCVFAGIGLAIFSKRPACPNLVTFLGISALAVITSVTLFSEGLNETVSGVLFLSIYVFIKHVLPVAFFLSLFLRKPAEIVEASDIKRANVSKERRAMAVAFYLIGLLFCFVFVESKLITIIYF